MLHTAGGTQLVNLFHSPSPAPSKQNDELRRVGTPSCFHFHFESSAPSRAFSLHVTCPSLPLKRTKRHGGVSKGSRDSGEKKRVMEQFSKLGFFWMISSPFAPLVLLSSVAHFDCLLCCTDSQNIPRSTSQSRAGIIPGLYRS